MTPVMDPATEAQLGHLQRRIEEQKPTFLSSVNPVFAESAQVAYMLHTLIRNYQKGGENYKSFFANSHLEAVHGAIKLGRHAAREVRDLDSGEVLFLDEVQYYSTFFDPLDEGPVQALVPGVQFFTELAALEQAAQADTALVIISLTEDNFAERARQGTADALRGYQRALDLSQLSLAALRELPKELLAQYDIIIWGESLSRKQFPFGAFSARDGVYKPWNSMERCLIHSSTYGGNGMVLSFVRDVLLQELFKDEHSQIRAYVDRIAEHRGTKYKVASAHLNEFLNLKYRATVPLDFVAAKGSYLYSKSSKGLQKNLDAVGGSGCSVRGHNPDDLIPEVLQQHSHSTNYLEPLVEQLQALTGLDRGMPGVSGASVVEMGMISALLANKGKKKVVVFNGNYAGKTLVAINGTADDHSHFEPLYPDLEMINPYTATARHDFQQLCETGEVGLVWFEFIQGGGLLHLPAEIISLVAKSKEQYGYFIGVDEILHGVYRTGNFLSFDPQLVKPDLITFAKGLSSMVFPFSMVMMSENVYQGALQTNPEWVLTTQQRFANQLGAHIAGHVLRKTESEGISENVKQRSKDLSRRIEEALQKSPVTRGIEVAGFHLRVNLAMNKYPMKFFKYQRAIEIMTYVFFKKGQIVTYFGRHLLPLNLSAREADEMVAGFQRVAKVPAWYYLWVGAKQYLHARWLILTRKLK